MWLDVCNLYVELFHTTHTAAKKHKVIIPHHTLDSDHTQDFCFVFPALEVGTNMYWEWNVLYFSMCGTAGVKNLCVFLNIFADNCIDNEL